MAGFSCRAPWIVLILGLIGVGPVEAQDVLYDEGTYTVTDTSVVQGDFRATAPSRDTLTSTYPRPRLTIDFRFALNGRTNERAEGPLRRLRVDPADDAFQTPVFVYGEPSDSELPTPTTEVRRAEGDSVAVTFRVDLRPVLRSFRDHGYYDPPAGTRIDTADFEGVYLLGDTGPLSMRSTAERFRLTDPDDDGVYRTRVAFERPDGRPVGEEGRARWVRTEDRSAYPSYRSEQPLIDALYNLSLEELAQNVREDGTYGTSENRPAVRTRDVSYSVLLSLAVVDPERAKASLLRRVTEDGRIRQDSGIGGGWPVSTDRMTWALAAWEVYNTTGDADWLKRSYDIIRRSAEADLATAFDSTTGLFHGAASTLDRPEQAYPGWMEPTDIYGVQALSTNVVHYRTYRILARMARTLNVYAGEWERVARRVKQGIDDHLWREDAGRYVGYRYGQVDQPGAIRTETLGSALAVLSGVTDAARAARVAENHPVVEFGTPRFWPYIPGVAPYQNAGVWPFVEGYWTWASAAVDNTPGVEHGLASMIRAAAFFLTNKKAMVAQTGHFEGTTMNADRHLGSISGLLATVVRVFFGLRFTTQGIRLDPFVPAPYSGTRTLEGLSYRGATLDLTMEGHGTRIVQVTLDGEPLERPRIPSDLEGQHDVRIVLSGGLPDGTINRVGPRYAPSTPDVERQGETLRWGSVSDAAAYRVVRNGTGVDTTLQTQYRVSADSVLAAYQVQAMSARGALSFRSEPVRVVSEAGVQTVQPEGTVETDGGGFTGSGYVPTTPDGTQTVSFEVPVEEAGTYALEVRYANGRGPRHTGSHAAVRTVRVEGTRLGAAVFPQRGEGAWEDWGYSNALRASLEAGTHTITLALTESEARGSESANVAHIDHLRVTRVAPRD